MTSQANSKPVVARALDMWARRKLAAMPAGSVRSERAWLKTATDDLWEFHGSRAVRALERHPEFGPVELADLLETTRESAADGTVAAQHERLERMPAAGGNWVPPGDAPMTRRHLAELKVQLATLTTRQASERPAGRSPLAGMGTAEIFQYYRDHPPEPEYSEEPF